MKFIPPKGAPNIPLALLEAQEADKLVFFCGAGISIPAGLPGFRDLVDRVYESLLDKPDTLESKAIDEGSYDRALYFLENRTRHNNAVRKAIINELTLKKKTDLSLHEAILELSKTNDQGCRLVTTNVDHGFKRAKKDFTIQIDAAPKLPIPKPHKWQSVVHLHGIIDNKADPDGKNLIFTSADFGSAYLTERWASEFVTELFRHFTVVFIGYSLNDPVMRYMTDAIAAETLSGYDGFKQPYVIAGVELPAKIEEHVESWQAKGIEPILYTYQGYDHSNLHNTLKEWAAYSRDGLNAKIRVIKQYAINKPLPPYEHDYNVQRILDILKENTDANYRGISGLAAKAFSDLNDPHAPIEWLPVLEENNLLSRAEYKTTIAPINNNERANIPAPNIITYNLWCWLLHHLENQILIEWVMEQGCYLHPGFKRLIKDKLKSNEKPKEPYLSFWDLVISDYSKTKTEYISDGYEITQAIEQGIDKLALNLIINSYLNPFLKLKKAFIFSNENDNVENMLFNRKPYNVEVSIGLSEYYYKEWKAKNGYPEQYVDLLLPVTQALNEALMLWEWTGHADRKTDPSFWDLVSIEPHKQNNYFDSWVILIELCRDLWQAALKSNPTLAESILHLWKSLNYPVFRRLFFYAYTYKPISNAKTVLNYLLEDDGWWLWSIVLRREKFRLLKKFWPCFKQKEAEKLLNIILIGPPRSMYRDDLAEDDWKIQVEHSIWLTLAKLESFGRSVTGEAKLKLIELNQRYPAWSLEGDERDEFSHWMESGWGFKSDISKEEFYSFSIPQLVNKLLNNKGSTIYKEGRISLFREECKKDVKRAIKILTYFKEHNIWDECLWDAALIGITDTETTSWPSIVNLLLCAPNNLFSVDSTGRSIAFWIRKAAKNIKPDSKDEKQFWPLINKSFNAINETIPSKLIYLDKDIDFIHEAINHPIGIITEALLERFGQRKLKLNEGIPKGFCFDYVNRIMSGKGDSFLMGQVILASRLSYFYAVDAIWTKERLLSSFNWREYPEARAMWYGYLGLGVGSVSINLALDLKSLLPSVFNNSKLLFKQEKQLYYFFAFLCLEYPNLYSKKEKQQVIKKMHKESLSFIFEYMWISLSKMEIKDKDIYWKNRIKPFIENDWPKTAHFINSKISEYLALMSIQLNNMFLCSLKAISLLLIPFENLFLKFMINLENSNLVDNKPNEVFKLIATAFDKKIQRDLFYREAVLNVFSRLLIAAPEIKNITVFKEIREYFLSYNIDINS